MENYESEQIQSASENAVLALHFKELLSNTAEKEKTFEELEAVLGNSGFELATTESVREVFENQMLMTRSENFTRVLDLVTNKTPIFLENVEKQANMCKMVSGQGFRVAMTEGFSGSDVGGVVKTVISFSGDHLNQTEPIDKDNDLWRTKPNTAKVSLAGNGTIEAEDLEMVSFRFPVHMFPENMLTDDEKDALEEEGIKFVVRHYLNTTKKSIH